MHRAKSQTHRASAKKLLFGRPNAACTAIAVIRNRVCCANYPIVTNAVQKRFQGEERFNVEKFIHREGIVYESNKCIKCGICVRLTREHQEEFGFTFIGRGFDVKIGVPFNESVQKGLEKNGGNCS